jgi:hypothetical protein
MFGHCGTEAGGTRVSVAGRVSLVRGVQRCAPSVAGEARDPRRASTSSSTKWFEVDVQRRCLAFVISEGGPRLGGQWPAFVAEGGGERPAAELYSGAATPLRAGQGHGEVLCPDRSGTSARRQTKRFCDGVVRACCVGRQRGRKFGGNLEANSD